MSQGGNRSDGKASSSRDLLQGSTHYGIAIDRQGITVVKRGRGRTLFSPVWERTRLPEVEANWEADLEDALAEMAELRSGSGARLSIALLAPYSRVLRLTLPSRRTADQRAILERNPGRFFSTVTGPAIITTLRSPAKRVEGRNSVVVASAAEVELVDRIISAGRATGYQIQHVVASPFAVVRRLIRGNRSLAHGAALLTIETGDAVICYFLRRGRVELVRSAPWDVLEGEASAVATASSSGIADWVERVITEGEIHHGLRVDRVAFMGRLLDPEFFSQRIGREVVRLGTTPQGELLDERRLAAEGALLTAEPELQLLPGWLRSRRESAERRLLAARVSICVLCLVAAALFHFAALRSQLEAVEDQRRVLRPAVDEIVRMRSTLAGVADRLEPLARAESAGPSWLGVLATITDDLPLDAHLITFRGDTVQVQLEIRARSAAEAVVAFDASPGFSNVTLLSPIRRELINGRSYERVSIGMTVNPAGASASRSRSNSGLGNFSHGSSDREGTPPTGNMAPREDR